MCTMLTSIAKVPLGWVRKLYDWTAHWAKSR